MRAVICGHYGQPEKLVMADCDTPQPGPGEVRIRVEAAGISYPDLLIVQGRYQVRPEPPFSPGAEVAAVVDSLGEGVEGFAPGDPVLGAITFGGFAQQAVVPAASLTKRPATVDAVTASVMALSYGTAIHALSQRANLLANETLLVLGAGGATGIAAVEIGKAMGATVIAAASGPAKLAAARDAGAVHLIDYSRESLKERAKELTQGRGVDVVFDPVGGNLFEDALRATGWGGRILVIGFASGSVPCIRANLPLLKSNAVVGVYYGAFLRRQPEVNRQNFARIFAWHKEGRLKPLIARTMDLSRFADGMALRSDPSTVGRVVLTVGGEAP